MSYLILRDLNKDYLIVKNLSNGNEVTLPLQGGDRGLKNVPAGEYEIKNADTPLKVSVASGRTAQVFLLNSMEKKWSRTLKEEDDFGYESLALSGAMDSKLIDLKNSAPSLFSSPVSFEPVKMSTEKTTWTDQDLRQVDNAWEAFKSDPNAANSHQLVEVFRWNYVHDSVMAKHVDYYIRYCDKIIKILKDGWPAGGGADTYIKNLWEDMDDVNSDEASAKGRELRAVYDSIKR
eukprot:TRINITY_DN3647_c0_g1_i2.p1 TRINITY_DN3647_c0_g1~~TRINITY_DN3647_c0_g1_i2.p1  ORF type:complete len:234 (+),score=79.26 TRINITY_DN3647_c0_g1_i2:89-790(+)